MAYTHLDPGQELEVSSHAYFSAAQTDLTPLVQLPPEALKAMEEASVQKEKAIFSEMEALSAKWVKQAEETLAARKAQEYLRSKPAPHTSNRWVDGEYDWHERSNMVYKFTWRVYEHTRWSRAAQTSVPVASGLQHAA